MNLFMTDQMYVILHYIMHQENLRGGEHISLNQGIKMWVDKGYAKAYAENH